MKDDELKIIVMGSADSGKSSISQYVVEQLREVGFDVNNLDDDEINYPTENYIQDIRLESTLLKHIKIEVSSIQVLKE